MSTHAARSFDFYHRAIHGELLLYSVTQHYEPDGDSVRFKADNIDDFNDLYRHYKIKPSQHDDSVQLRFEGVDALELHFQNHAQPGGKDARDKLLEDILGFKNIIYDNNGTRVKSSEPDSIPATILSKASDPFGRPISYILIGNERNKFKDDEIVNVDLATLDKTVNIQVLKEGFAYPLVYTSTPRYHRDHIRQIAKQLQTQRKGIWKNDGSSSFRLEDYSSIDDPHGSPIFPKLYRRCVDYLKDYLDQRFSGDLVDWILSKGDKENDQVLINETDFPSKLSNIVEVHNSKISLTANITDLIFVEK
jgi:endonuclease YncB( thermonuclease family)